MTLSYFFQEQKLLKKNGFVCLTNRISTPFQAQHSKKWTWKRLFNTAHMGMKNQY